MRPRLMIINGNTFGERLMFARERLHFSQTMLGKACGVQGKMISEYENDRKTPRLRTAVKLADVLEVPLDALTKGME